MIGILNNEALALISMQTVLAITPRINIANSYLISPLLLDKKIRGYLKRKSTKVLSAQDIVLSGNERFIGFDEKFTDSLIVSTNAIAMGLELGFFTLEEGELVEKVPASFSSGELGTKVNDISRASENVARLLSESPASLYRLLRIEL